MIGLGTEELNLLLLHGEQYPASRFYRAASLVFEAFLPKRAIRDRQRWVLRVLANAKNV
jgi:hypothetical protein